MKTALKQFLLSGLLLVVVFYASSFLHHTAHPAHSFKKSNHSQRAVTISTVELTDADGSDIDDGLDEDIKLTEGRTTFVPIAFYVLTTLNKPLSYSGSSLFHSKPLYLLNHSFRI